jgi:hypothetical protein
LRQDDLPPFDRPLRFAVQRGNHAPLQADSISAMQSLLKQRPAAQHNAAGEKETGRPGTRGHKRKGHRRGRSPGPHGRSRR